MDVRSENLLSGRKGLVVGMANGNSIAYGCARMFRNCGAELAITWLDEKTRSYVEPLARELSATIMMPLDWLGMDVDPNANRANASTISTPTSRVRVVVRPITEERMAARHAVRMLLGANETKSASLFVEENCNVPQY
jgi:enoyl-[acyl-carrier-protein] reductase (NADH)